MTIEIKKGYIGNDETEKINQVCIDFKKLYDEIEYLCNSSDICISYRKDIIMDFDLKTALSLLPVMTDELHVTKQLIDAIEYYETTLKEASKSSLINFVLKSRLSQSAKLRLSPNYDSVSELITDMKKILLPQKSATALQNQLLNCKQNEMSLSDYGNMISELFTELTISQAGDDKDSVKVLKPLNEKLAIKRFADGLRNRRLNTIILARNFDSLKDAIQAAVDEDTSLPSTSQNVMAMRSPNNNYFRYNNRFFRGYNSRGHFFRGNPHHNRGSPRTHYTRQHGNFAQKSGNQWSRVRGRGRGFTGRGQQHSTRWQGKSFNNRGNSRSENQQIHVVTESNINKYEDENDFFRE